MLAGLPDMPDLVLDALTQMRNSGQWQDRQLRELAHLRQELRSGRRRDALAGAGLAAGLALALAGSGAVATLGAVLVLAAFGWRLAAG